MFYRELEEAVLLFQKKDNNNLLFIIYYFIYKYLLCFQENHQKYKVQEVRAKKRVCLAD
jgi:hypothetical protein